MEISQLDYDFNKVDDNSFRKIKEERKCIDLKPEMFDYMIGDKSSLRFEWIKELQDKEEKLSEMTKLLKEILPKGLPDEFYDWYSRECLGLQYKKWEIKAMKRKYKIERRREIEKKKKEDKLKKKRLQVENKKVILEF